MILLKTTVIPAVLCLTLGAATALHAQERLRTGMWENTVTAASGQSGTHSSCLKPEDTAKSNGPAAVVRTETEKAMSKSACTLKDFNLDGNTLTMTMVCAGTATHQETKFLWRRQLRDNYDQHSGWRHQSHADQRPKDRSEERRVGKECRSRWSPNHSKK